MQSFNSLSISDLSLSAVSCSSKNTDTVNNNNLSTPQSFDSLSAMFKSTAPPSCPGLIRNCPVPPPVPMQWQLTIPSDHDDMEEIVDCDGDMEEIVSDYDSDSLDLDSMLTSFPSMRSIQHSSSLSSIHSMTPQPEWIYEMDPHHLSSNHHELNHEQHHQSLNVEILQNVHNQIKCINDKTSATSRDNILRVLYQFHDNKRTYDDSYDLVLNGYIRRLQKEFESEDKIIPTEINQICSSFYYQQENEYIDLAQEIYSNLDQLSLSISPPNEEQPENTFSGKDLIRFITEINPKLSADEIHTICHHFAQYQFIEIVSYKTNFSSLFLETPSIIKPNTQNNDLKDDDNDDDDEENHDDKDTVFHASDDYLYYFTNEAQAAFNEYVSSHS